MAGVVWAAWFDLLVFVFTCWIPWVVASHSLNASSIIFLSGKRIFLLSFYEEDCRFEYDMPSFEKCQKQKG